VVHFISLINKLKGLHFVKSVHAVTATAAPKVTFKVEAPDVGFGKNIGDVINTGVTWAIAIGAIATLIFVLVGGFNYITAGDDPDKAEGARKTLTNGVIGLIILAAAFAIWRLLVSILNLETIFPAT